MLSVSRSHGYGSRVLRFSTARLVAEPVTLADAPIFERLWGDARVARTLGGPRDAHQVHASITASVQHWNAHGFGRWLLRLDGKPIGNVKLARTSATGQPEVELGYALFPEHWGAGYATEAARGALSVAKDLGFATVIAFALITNQASFSVMQSLGFVYEQVLALPEGAHAVWRLTLSDGYR